MRLFSGLLAFLSFTILLNCSKPIATTEEAEAPPTRRELTRKAMRASVWKFVYCLEPGDDEGELVSFLEEVAAAQPFGKRIEVINCDDMEKDSLGTTSFSLFGSRMPTDARELPLKMGEGEKVFAGHHSLHKEDVLLLPYYKNPWSEGNAVAAFYLAEKSNNIVSVLKQEIQGNWDKLFWPNWAYEIHRENGDRIYGSFADTTWAFDHTKDVELKAPNEPVFSEDGLIVYAYDGAVRPEEITAVTEPLQQIQTLVASLLPVTKQVYPEVRLYPNLERIGLRQGNMNPIQFDPEENILHVVPTFLKAGDLLVDIQTWLPFLADLPRAQVQGEFQREAVAVVQQQVAEQLGQAHKARFHQALRLHEIGILALPNQDDPSDYILEAKARIAAAMVGLLPADKLPAAIAGYIAGKKLPPKKTDLGNAPTLASKTMPENKLAGMTFAHEGYRVHNGYGGEKIKPSLDSLSQLNVNSLAIVPYTFMRDPFKPTTLFIPQGAGSENDWATICSAREAESRNWFSLLKPQIWVGGGHWPGSVDFENEEDWDAFFQNYTYWIVHYAALAERHGIDGLVLGTELVNTTVKHPDQWREIIRKVRTVYGGQLTYAANWGEEFEKFAFWDDLDAIGLNSYYPISTGDAPSDTELEAGAKRWLDMAAEVSRKHNKPLWLTEVGYRSVEKAWVQPHEEAGEKAFSAIDQARCYQALWTAAGKTPELKGAFIWKWPSYIGYDGGRRATGRGFTPGGKVAADRLADFYGIWE
jgi:hypothetical protein